MRRLLENAIAFSSCVGGFKDVIQSPAGERGRGDSTGVFAERSSPDRPRKAKRLSLQSTAKFLHRSASKIKIRFIGYICMKLIQNPNVCGLIKIKKNIKVFYEFLVENKSFSCLYNQIKFPNEIKKYIIC